MEGVADSLSSAYQDFVGAAADVLEAKEQSNGQKSPATDAALESFKQSWELFRVSCDQAEELVESLKQRIGSECLVDEATGAPPQSPSSAAATATATATAGGIPPISAVRLEQMSKAVRWLVIELQQHGGSASASVSSAAAASASASSSAAQTPQQLPSVPFDDAAP